MLWLVTRRASSWHRLHWKIVLLLLCLKTLDRVPRCTSCKNKYPSWDNKLCYYVRVTQQLIITMQIDTYQNTSTVKKLSSSYYICNMYIQYIHCRLYSLLFIYAKAGLMPKKQFHYSIYWSCVTVCCWIKSFESLMECLLIRLHTYIVIKLQNYFLNTHYWFLEIFINPSYSLKKASSFENSNHAFLWIWIISHILSFISQKNRLNYFYKGSEIL